MDIAVIDAQVLFYFHYRKEEAPKKLLELKNKVINKEITVVIPIVAIAELFYKMRKKKDEDTEADVLERLKKLQTAIKRWRLAENIIIDNFDQEILDLMLQNKEAHEIFDEIIAMSCKKHNTRIIYATDPKFKAIFGLDLRTWK